MVFILNGPGVTIKAAVRKHDVTVTVTATLQNLTMFQRIGLISGVTSFGLPGGNDAISGRRPDNSIENVKEYGRKYDRQNNVHRYPQWFSRPA
ncbi:hypothetical protein [Arthrobacter nitrophenolicus]|uniref:hypothetical protein n=1 Tax=Arthrobacter nitrophenolicus TaxID=683150 RepID=UPI0014045E7F|nr:hypothetical protein [Arthrobacter nitrophenolicus]